MFQVQGVEITEYSAKAIGIPLETVKTAGEKEKELEPLKRRLEALELDGAVSGALRSEYQRRRLDRICQDIGIRSFAPMWHKSSDKILEEMISEGWEIIISAVAAQGLDESWLGRRLDRGAIKELKAISEKYAINIDGEGGEFETVVTWGPTFEKRVVIDEYVTEWRRDSGKIIIKSARLEEP